LAYFAKLDENDVVIDVHALNNIEMLTTMVAVQAQHNTDLLSQQQMAHQSLVQQLTKPKQVVRGADGKIVGVQ